MEAERQRRCGSSRRERRRGQGRLRPQALTKTLTVAPSPHRCRDCCSRLPRLPQRGIILPLMALVLMMLAVGVPLLTAR
jgi:hypothetical protein